MPLIEVAQARTGMVLSADVCDRRGRVLIPGGKELKERYLAALPMWGITHVEVEGEEARDQPTEVPGWAFEQADRDVAPRFKNANRAHPAIESLYAVCLERRAEHLHREGAEERATA